MVRIKGNEPALYQYDTGKELIIEPRDGCIVGKVELFNGTTEKAKDAALRMEDEGIIAGIPDEFLKSTNKIHAYVVMLDGEKRTTTEHAYITVIGRAEPEVSEGTAEPDNPEEPSGDPVDVAAVLADTEIYIADYSISEDIQITAGVIDVWRRCIVS